MDVYIRTFHSPFEMCQKIENNLCQNFLFTTVNIGNYKKWYCQDTITSGILYMCVCARGFVEIDKFYICDC